MSTSRAGLIGAVGALAFVVGCAPPAVIPLESVAAPAAVKSPAASRTQRLHIARLEAIRRTTFPKPHPMRVAPRPRPMFVRGVYGRDSSSTGVGIIREAGFNSVTAMPSRTELDRLAASGLKALVWLWGYDGSTCSFSHGDSALRRELAAIAGHPAILAYQIADEPDRARAAGCSRVPQQIRARSALIHSIDPGVPTYIVVSTWDGREGHPYRYFAGTTDVMGLDVYPYSREFSRPQMIDAAVREASRAGVRRYWAVIQDFSDGYYVAPTAAQVGEQLRRWGRSRMEGYFVYHWNAGDIEAHPDHEAVYAASASSG